MKISIIGASGRVGIETTRLFAEQNDFSENINVILGEIPDLSAQLICNIKQNRIIPITTSLSHNNINKIKEGADFIGQELQKLETQTLLITNERSR